MEPSVQKPIVYEICIEGEVDPCWSKRLSLVAIKRVYQGENGLITVLSGEIADQATLFGLLLALYDLKLPLVSVQRMEGL